MHPIGGERDGKINPVVDDEERVIPASEEAQVLAERQRVAGCAGLVHDLHRSDAPLERRFNQIANVSRTREIAVGGDRESQRHV